MSPGRRAAAFLPLFLVYLAVVLAAVDYAFYRRYAARVRAAAPPQDELVSLARAAGVSPELYNSLGSLYPAPVSGYPLFPAAKPTGVLRVGAFGDSFTRGDEAGPGLDYPSQLGALFKKRGFRNVEVINFGSSWWGFGQSFRFWERFGKDYGLDVLLLGPQSFFADRTVAFAHGGESAPFYVHGRYVLDGGAARWVDPVYRPDLWSRGWAYHSFIPKRRYLTYDRPAPAFLRCLLPASRSLDNPFYYRNESAVVESMTLFELLLARAAKESPGAVLLHADSTIARLGEAAPSGLIASAIRMPRSFPYWRLHHPSGAGYALLARAYFDVLTGRDPAGFDWLRFRAAETGAAREIRLAAATRADLVAADATLGTLVYARRSEEPEAVVDFKRDGVESLLALRSPRSEPLDAMFLALKTPLTETSTVVLRVRDAAGERRVGLGRPRRFNAALPVAFVSVEGAEVVEQSADPRKLGAVLLSGNWLRSVGSGIRTFRSGAVLVDGREVYRLRRWDRDRLVLEPVGVRHAQFKPAETASFDVDRFDRDGTARLRLAGIPEEPDFARWTKENFRFAYERRGVRTIPRY
ncbi:MAG: SGNH/GDSL hydrolase family protein [Elusimicrobia bacterium]|nr:SGNH/GDSL hydrolase family protein [Elusimicrobiota bacterium]